MFIKLRDVCSGRNHYVNIDAIDSITVSEDEHAGWVKVRDIDSAVVVSKSDHKLLADHLAANDLIQEDK